MATLKTKKTEASAKDFIQNLADEQVKSDCLEIMDLMRKASKFEPKMWGPSIVGFGSYHYKYDSGHEGDWFICGFSPRKQNLTLYLMAGFEHFPELMKKLGKYKTSKSCLYIKKLSDIDQKVLKELIAASVKLMA